MITNLKKATYRLLPALAVLASWASPAAARDAKAIDVSTLQGRPLNADEQKLFEGSWVELYLKDPITPEIEEERNRECKYLFGQSMFDTEPSEDLEELSKLAPGLAQAKGQVYITHNDTGPIIATEGVWNTSVQSGEVNRINASQNGWFSISYYTGLTWTEAGENLQWKKAPSLEDGQVFKTAFYHSRIIKLPSGALTPIMQDITYGVPRNAPDTSKFLVRCENYIPPQQ